MRVVLDRTDEMVAWASERIQELHGQGFPDNTTGIGIEDENGRILGVVCFHSYEPWNRTIEVSAVAEDARWLMARKAWATMFDYAYQVCDVDKIWSRTPAKNERALRFLRAVGFECEAVLPRQFGDDDAVISAKFKWNHYAASRPQVAPDKAA